MYTNHWGIWGDWHYYYYTYISYIHWVGELTSGLYNTQSYFNIFLEFIKK